MIIGHAPAGYLLAKIVYGRKSSVPARYVWVLVAASILPDLDLLYFYIIDNRAHNHHDYWTHIPLYWLALYYLAMMAAMMFDKLVIIIYATLLLSGVMLHLLLDTITGGIQWAYPFSNQHYTVIKVPAVYDWWVFNFVVHWTFLLELILLGLAGLTYLITRQIKPFCSTSRSVPIH